MTLYDIFLFLTYFTLYDSLCCCCIASVVSNSVRPQRWQPTRLPRPWGSPGKNTGVSCHFLLQCMKVKSESEVAQSCPTLSDPMDCSPPGFSIHGIFQQEYWSGLPLPSPIVLLIYVNETICMVICPSTRFKSIVLWPRMTHLVPRLSQNTSYG